MGIFLTLLGAFMTLDTLQILDLSRALRFWPIGFHILGITILMRRPDQHGRFWGIAWIVIGTWMLLNTLGLARIGFWELFWPAILVFVGVRLILRARAGGPPVSAGDPATVVSDTLGGMSGTGAAGSLHRPNLVAVMSESKSSVTQPFAGASMTSVMGGCHLDLRQATVPAGTVPVIDVFSLMGGQEIVLPPGWTVTFDVVSILAGTEDKRLPAIGGGSSDIAAPHVIIRGVTIFSGVTVKN